MTTDETGVPYPPEGRLKLATGRGHLVEVPRPYALHVQLIEEDSGALLRNRPVRVERPGGDILQLKSDGNAVVLLERQVAGICRLWVEHYPDWLEQPLIAPMVPMPVTKPVLLPLPRLAYLAVQFYQADGHQVVANSDVAVTIVGGHLVACKTDGDGIIRIRSRRGSCSINIPGAAGPIALEALPERYLVPIRIAPRPPVTAQRLPPAEAAAQQGAALQEEKHTELRVIVHRDINDPDARDDKVRLFASKGGGYDRKIGLLDDAYARELEEGVTEVTFRDVPHGQYDLFIDMGLDEFGQVEGGYFLFRDVPIPMPPEGPLDEADEQDDDDWGDVSAPDLGDEDDDYDPMAAHTEFAERGTGGSA